MPAVEKAETTAAETDVFELVYQGPDVDSGTMNSGELAEVFSGITKAFNIVAQERDLGDDYELRLKDVKHESYHLIFEAIAYAKTNPAPAAVIVAGASLTLQAMTNTVSGAYRLITDVGAMILAKRKAKGERIATIPTQFVDGDVRLETPDGFVLLTREQYELLLSQRVDKQLAQIVSPLAPKRIDRFFMRRAEVELASVEAGQKGYFDYREVTEDQSREGTQIVGTLNSLTKTSLKGTFYTTDGVHVPYKYTGGDIQQLLRGFSSREPLRVRGKIKYGSDGIPQSVEIQEIDFVQRRLTGS